MDELIKWLNAEIVKGRKLERSEKELFQKGVYQGNHRMAARVLHWLEDHPPSHPSNAADILVKKKAKAKRK